MECPACGSNRSKVLKTENISKNKVRRRICADCSYYFSTVESILTRTSRIDKQANPGKPKKILRNLL